MRYKRFQQWTLRVSFAIVFAWFGITKVFAVSPAAPLVLDLLKMTLPFFPPQLFLPVFGMFEVLIGFGFLLPKYTKVVIVTALLHLCMTMLPLVLLPQHTWISFGVLSTEGQYIMKNLILYAALWGLWLDAAENVSVIRKNEVESGTIDEDKTV